MSPLGKSKHVAARMGRWSASHWKTATFGWLAFVIAAFAIGNVVGTKALDDATSGPGESGKVARIADKEFKTPIDEKILIQSTSLTTADPAFKATVQDVARKVEVNGLVKEVHTPYDSGNAGLISKDGHSALIDVKLYSTDLDKADENVDTLLAITAGAQKAHSGFTIEEVGDASIDKALNDQFGKDLGKAGKLSLPVTLGILLVAFGAIVAAGIPLLLGITAVVATMGLLALPSQLIPMDENIFAIILLIGLAVGVDYSLFYMKREREERKAGRSERAALEAAAATSGRAVLISGLTVMVAMAGMFFTGDKTFVGFGIGTMLVVAMAVLGSLTVLPALLSRLGDKVNKGRIPLGRRFWRHEENEGRVWNAILDRVLKRPKLSVLVSAGVLVAIAAPAIQMKTSIPGPETYPTSIPVMKSYAKLQKAFPGGEIPAQVLVKADDVRSANVQSAIQSMEQKALATGKLHEPVDESYNKAGTIAIINLPVDGQGTDAASNESLRTLREDVIPATLDKEPAIEFAGVTGQTAGSWDFNQQMKSALPFVFAFVLLFAFGLLLVTFRSIVIAVKAIVLNLLSVAAAYGVLTMVFQHGWGKGLLGVEYTDGIVAFLPIFLFVILFGLSMDYHVFILSRIREAYDRGMKTEDAVSYGIKSTASVVTMAALVMVFVFGIFGTLSMLMLKQFGVGLAAAVLIDATIVRAVLLPATMKLLGDWNWYLPKWLEWLPQVKHETAPAAEPAAPLADAA
jgi:RND superfamily putative drug exporter